MYIDLGKSHIITFRLLSRNVLYLLVWSVMLLKSRRHFFLRYNVSSGSGSGTLRCMCSWSSLTEPGIPPFYGYIRVVATRILLKGMHMHMYDILMNTANVNVHGMFIVEDVLLRRRCGGITSEKK